MFWGCIAFTEVPAWSAKRGHSNLELRQRVLPPLVLPVTVGGFFGVDGEELGGLKGGQ